MPITSINGSATQVQNNNDLLLQDRLAKAVCTISFGEDICSPAKNPAAETFLNFARFFAPGASTEISATGKDEINFNWGDNDYQLLCGAGTCRIFRQNQSSPVNTLLAGVANFVSGLTTGCGTSSNEENVGQFDDSTTLTPPPPFESDSANLKFCITGEAWPTYYDTTTEPPPPFEANGEKEFEINKLPNCIENANIQDNLSTCVYLKYIRNGMGRDLDLGLRGLQWVICGHLG